MTKIIFLFTVFINIIFANSITLFHGWNLIGAIDNIDLNRTFSNHLDIDIVWSFNNEKKDWIIFGNSKNRRDLITKNNLIAFKDIKKGHGFWVLNTGYKNTVEVVPLVTENTNTNFAKCINNKLGKSANYNPTETELESITYLDCNNTNIDNITGVGKLINLISLSLDTNQITNIPSEIKQLTNLTSFAVGSNKLTEISPEILKLNNLKFLYYWDNKIDTLPIEISNLVNLKELYLNNNKLKKIPSEIGNLINLTNLSFWDNQLTQFPIEMSNLINLEILDLDNNKFTEIPLYFNSLTKLYRSLQTKSWSYIYRDIENETPVEFLERVLSLN